MVQVVKNPPANAEDTGRRSRFDPWVRMIPWRRKWQLTPVSFLGNSMDRGSFRATVHEAAKSQTQRSN